MKRKFTRKEMQQAILIVTEEVLKERKVEIVKRAQELLRAKRSQEDNAEKTQ